MQWQDALLSTGSIIFIIALLPSVFGKHKPAVATSVMTSTVLVTYVVAYSSLKLWFAATLTMATAALWCLLALQQFFLQHQKPADAEAPTGSKSD